MGDGLPGDQRNGRGHRRADLEYASAEESASADDQSRHTRTVMTTATTRPVWQVPAWPIGTAGAQADEAAFPPWMTPPPPPQVPVPAPPATHNEQLPPARGSTLGPSAFGWLPPVDPPGEYTTGTSGGANVAKNARRNKRTWQPSSSPHALPTDPEPPAPASHVGRGVVVQVDEVKGARKLRAPIERARRCDEAPNSPPPPLVPAIEPLLDETHPTGDATGTTVLPRRSDMHAESAPAGSPQGDWRGGGGATYNWTGRYGSDAPFAPPPAFTGPAYFTEPTVVNVHRDNRARWATAAAGASNFAPGGFNFGDPYNPMWPSAHLSHYQVRPPTAAQWH
eukprot:Opistho-1_new@48357